MLIPKPRHSLIGSLVLSALVSGLMLPAARGQTAAGERVIRLPITLESDQRTELHARVEGYVSSVQADIGDIVVAGQVLISLDTPALQADVNRRKQMLGQAEANLRVVTSSVDTAKARLAQAVSTSHEQVALTQLRTSERDRYQQLVRSGAVQQEKLDEARFGLLAVEAATAKVQADIQAAEADIRAAESHVEFARTGIEVARAELAHAQALLDFRDIKAPFAGLVTYRGIDVGALVSPGMTSSPLLVVENIDVVRGVMTVPADDAAWIRVGAGVTFEGFGDPATLKSPSGRAAQVSRISQTLDMKTRTMRVEIDIANTYDPSSHRYHLLSGQYGAASIAVDDKP